MLRQTMRKRLQAKLSEVKAELQRRMHDPVPEVGKWLRSVVGGHFRYYGVPMNSPALCDCSASRWAGSGIARCARRSQTRPRHLGPDAAAASTASCLSARICHPYPLRRLGVIT